MKKMEWEAIFLERKDWFLSIMYTFAKGVQEDANKFTPETTVKTIEF